MVSSFLFIFYSSLMMITCIMFMLLSIFLFNNMMFISMEIPIWTSNTMDISISMMFDWISTLFMATVMFISSMILIFSMSYIDKLEFNQFSMILLTFVMSMLVLISSDNIIFLLLGWDGLGISSFILVIYYQNFSSAASGTITILSNRLGDIAILLSISLLTILTNWNFWMNENFPLLVMILLIIAAISKSAQYPFSAWLPAAMAAPTPISALVHSSTLVTAGVFLLIRVMDINHPQSMMMLLLLSSATTLYASMTANWEQDMKKIIALSTLSQIGMMMFSISIGAPNIAFFHLIIHALFKSMMFLCAGMMIHNFSYQDMRNMNMMKTNSPLMTNIMMISNMTLMGLPFMSGFFSKDLIMETLISSKMMSMISLIMMLSIGMTASYSMRMTKFSMKIYMKIKPDNHFSNCNLMEYPLIMMMPSSLFMGSMLSWMMFPTQLLFLPNYMKISILFILTMGLMFGTIMNFNSMKFMQTGYSSISLWFLNYLSSLPTKFTFLTMFILQKNDKTWQEMYGPQYSYYSIKNSSKIMDMVLLKPSFILLMILVTPIMFMLL